MTETAALHTATPMLITADEYFEFPETSQPMQLIDGEVLVAPAPEIYHQKIAYNIVRFFIKNLDDQGELFFSPIDVRLDEHNVLQPDVMWVSGPDSLCQRDADGKRWHGAPDLVCEILSRGTAKRDRETKFRLYEKYGTREYWILDPGNQSMQVYTRDGEKLVLLGSYHEAVFTSPLLNHAVDTREIFKSV